MTLAARLRAIGHVPLQFRLFREFENGWVKSALKAVAISVFRRRVRVYPRYWL